MKQDFPNPDPRPASPPSSSELAEPILEQDDTERELLEIQRRRARLVGEEQESFSLWGRGRSEGIDPRGLRRHLPFASFLLLLGIFAVLWPYTISDKHLVVAKLEEEVELLRKKSFFSAAERIRLERLSSIEEQVASLGLGLERSTRPPYLLSPQPERGE